MGFPQLAPYLPQYCKFSKITTLVCRSLNIPKNKLGVFCCFSKDKKTVGKWFHRETNGPRLFRYSSCNCLSYPPMCVSWKFKTFLWIKLFTTPNKTHTAFLWIQWCLRSQITYREIRRITIIYLMIPLNKTYVWT